MATESGEVQESAGQFQPESAAPVSADDQAIVKEVRDNIAFVKSYESAQRQAEDEQEIFAHEDMWDKEARENRDGDPDDAENPIPARPALSIPLHEQHVQTIVAEARQARLALTLKPRTGFAMSKMGDYMKGVMLKVQAESGALSIRLHALERAAYVGRAFYMLDAEFDTDEEFDLNLFLKRIVDQSTVYLDPYRTRADGKDMGWGILSEKISEAERIRRWPEKPIVAPDTAWSEGDDWFSVDAENGNMHMCRFATYYKVEFDEDILAYHPQVGKKLLKDMPAEIQLAVKAGATGTRQRPIQRRRVAQYTVDGSQVLERGEWKGQWVPIFTVIGKEYYLRHRLRHEGVIAKTMDILSAINVVLSAAIEVAGALPRAPYIMYEGQDENFEDEWDNLAVANVTRVHIKRESIDGKPAPFPQRQMLEPAIQGLMLLLRVLQDFFHGVTGGVAPSQRAVNPYDRSGKAIEALQRQSQAGTSNYLDNLATITMPFEGESILDAVPHYLDREGRIVRVSSDEQGDAETAIMLKVPFTRDANGMPVPVPCPACKGRGIVRATITDVLAFKLAPQPCPACKGSRQATEQNMPEVWEDQTVEYVDFSKAKFSVVPAIDRNYQAKQEEALAGMSDLAKAAPELVPAYAATWVRAMGFSGAIKVADAIEAAFPSPSKDLGNEKIPPKALQEIARLRQEHDAAMQALSEATKIIETDQIKALGNKEIAQMKLAFQAKLEALKVQGKTVEKHAEVTADATLLGMKAQIDKMLQDSQHQHEVLLQLLKERGEKEVERHAAGIHEEAESIAHERLLEQGATEHQQTLSEAEQKHRHAAEQTEVKGEVETKKIDRQAAHASTQQKTQAQIDAEAADRAHAQNLESQEQAAKLKPTPEPKK